MIDSHHLNAPNCMKPLRNLLLLTLFRDKRLQSTELLIVSWFITFGIMQYQIFVVFRGDFLIDISLAGLIVLDFLIAVESVEASHNRGYTAREVLKIALMSDDFPVPDY